MVGRQRVPTVVPLPLSIDRILERSDAVGPFNTQEKRDPGARFGVGRQLLSPGEFTGRWTVAIAAIASLELFQLLIDYFLKHMIG